MIESTKIAKNTIIQITGKILSILIGVLTLGLTTRYLGQIGYGYYTTVLVFLQIFGILMDFGLYLTLVREISEQPEKENQIFNNVFTLRFFSAILFLSLAPLVAIFLPYPAIVKWGIALTTLAFLFNSMVQIMMSIFQRRMAMGRAMLAEVIGRLVHLLIIILIIYLSGNLLAVLFGNIFNTLVYFLALFFFAKGFLKIKFAFDLGYWKRIIIKTWPIAVGIIFNLIYFKTDTLILSLIKPASDVGIYGAPYKFLEILATLPHLFLGLILPILTATWVQKNINEFKKIYQICFDLFAIIGLPLIFGGLVLATPLIVFFAGSDFIASGPVLKILIVATVLIFFGTLFNYLIVAIDQQKKILKYFIITSILSVVGYLIFIPLYSYYGAAWITVFSEGLITIASFWLGYRLTKIGLSLKILLKIIPASLIMMLVIIPLKSLPIIPLVFLGIAVYGVLLILFKAIRIDFIKSLFVKATINEEPTLINE